MVASVLVDPDGVVDQKEDLTDPRDESSDVGSYFILNEDEKEQGDLEDHERDDCQYLRVEVLVQSSREHAHDADAEVDDAAQNAQLGLIHVVVLLHGFGAGREDAVVEVDEHVGEDHQSEGTDGRTIVVDALLDFLLRS